MHLVNLNTGYKVSQLLKTLKIDTAQIILILSEKFSMKRSEIIKELTNDLTKMELLYSKKSRI